MSVRPHAVAALATSPPQSASDLPRETLDLMEETPFRGEKEHTRMLLSPFPVLVPGMLLLRPGHGMSSSGSPL